MIVAILLAFTGLAAIVWKDLWMNEGSTADWWISFLLLGLALAWFVVIVLAEHPPRPLEELHDTLIKIPRLRPYIDSH